MDLPVEPLLCLDKFSLKVNNTPDKAIFCILFGEEDFKMLVILILNQHKIEGNRF